MYKYCVEVFENEGKKNKKVTYGPYTYVDITLFETIASDEHCAELEARKKYPKAKIGQVTRISDYIEKYPNV